MSRWHAGFCKNPDIVVDNGLPQCQTCRAVPDLEGLIDQQRRLEAKSGQPWALPKDEPIGEMNLFWPDCVQYAKNQDQEATDDDRQQNANEYQSAESTSAWHASTEPPSSRDSEQPSYVYERRLGGDEFRIVCLSAANHYPGVVHVTLETYPVDDCPEYETVSYAWGGEDGNSGQHHPVYLGKYWDIMLHTKNCWSLLAYLQPERGIRLVWIDSLCINQLDNKEKVVQVGSMGGRYRNCTRVVVYLGPDYVVPATSGSHSRRVPFHEMHDDTFRWISQARYFRRIWVVQELIMAPSAIIPVGGTDFVVGRDTITARFRMGHDPRWDSSPAPWMSQISTGGTIQYQKQETQLLDALQLTHKSESSDPRDRIFGILGLVHPDTFPAANYDISTFHVSIGLFSHVILNLKRISALLGASSLRNTQLGYPSWLPDWKSSITSKTKYPNANRIGLSQALQDLAHAILLDTPEKEISEHMKAIRILLDKSRPDWYSLPSSYSCCKLRCDDHQVLRLVINAYDDARTSDDLKQRCLLTEVHRKWWGSSLDGAAIPWDKGAYIRSSSGALSMHLTHLLHFNTQPEVIMSRPDICLLRIRSDASSHTSNLFLGTLPNPNVDFFNLSPGSKDLFILPGTGNSPSLILFMKRHTGGSGFKLLACCHCIDLFFMTSTLVEIIGRQTSYTENLMLSLHRKVQVFHETLESFEESERPPREFIYLGYIDNELIRPPLYRVDFGRLEYEPLFMKGEWPVWDVLFVVQGLVNQRRGKPGSFFARYREKQLSKSGKDNNPELVDGYLEITVDRFRRYGVLFNSEWEVKTGAGAWVRETKLPRWSRRHKIDLVNERLRVPMPKLEEFLSQSVYYWMLRQVTPYSRKTGIDEYEILRGGPKEEYRSEFSLDFPEEIQEAFNVDLWTRMVTIV